MKHSVIHASRSGLQVAAGGALALSAEDVALDMLPDLARLGIHIGPAALRGMMRDIGAMDSAAGFGMDDSPAMITTPSVLSPIQFLQAWLPGLVRTVTQARKADEVMGIMTVGSWEDEEIIQAMVEPVGQAALYGDLTNIPLASWNQDYARRTIVRFEKGFQVGLLEEARAARVNINSAAEKRNAAALALDIMRNRIAFFGFNGGLNRTYGFLNDPSLPAYVTVPATGTGSSTLWANKTFLQITADLRLALSALQTASGDTIDPETTPITLAVATDRVQFLTVTSEFGNSVREWLRETYPKVRVVSVPELNGANGGASVFYVSADRIEDGGTDGGQVWAQLVPAKFKALGTEKRAKGYLEDFSNATAGVMLKRPFGVRRYSGI